MSKRGDKNKQEKEYLGKEALAVKYVLFRDIHTPIEDLEKGFFYFMESNDRKISQEEAKIWISRAMDIVQGKNELVSPDTLQVIKDYLKENK